MDLTIRVTWEDGQTTRHELSSLPHLPEDQIIEALEMDLASYLDADEMPLSPEGWALAWDSVSVVRDRDGEARGFTPATASGGSVEALLDWVALGFPAEGANAQVVAAVRAHEAAPTRYERRLRIPATSAFAHEKGSLWQPGQMCADQWQQLEAIRARDRERRQRRREPVRS